MSFDINKPYQTRDGHEAWAVSTAPLDKGEVFIGWFLTDTGRRVSAQWYASGAYYDYKVESFNDLVNIPEKRTVKVCINVYDAPKDSEYATGFYAYPNRAVADESATRYRIACIEREITYEVGEGLEP